MFYMSWTLIIIHSSRGKIFHKLNDIPLRQSGYILDRTSVSGKLLRKFIKEFKLPWTTGPLIFHNQFSSQWTTTISLYLVNQHPTTPFNYSSWEKLRFDKPLENLLSSISWTDSRTASISLCRLSVVVQATASPLNNTSFFLDEFGTYSTTLHTGWKTAPITVSLNLC
jgi:hypothetical protein